MATHDYDIANQSGAAFRTDLNNALAAIQSNNSNSSSPSTTVAYQWWADTSTGILKIRNSSNNGWVELLQLDGTLTLEDGNVSTPALAFRDDLNTGIYSSAADTFNVATGGVERMELGAATIFNEDGADVDFRIEGDTEANLFCVDAGNNRIGIGTNTPNELLNIHGSGDTQINISSDSDQFKISCFSNGDAGLETVGSFPIRFFTASSERMRIDSSGKVGIGTTSVSQPLHLANSSGNTIFELQRTDTNVTGAVGTISFTASDGHSLGSIGMLGDGDNEGGSMFFRTTTAAANNDPFNAATPERMRIDSSGNVGIGTTNGGAKLNVVGSSSSTSATSANSTYIFASNTDQTNNNFTGITFGDRTDAADFCAAMVCQITDHAQNFGNLQFFTNGSSGRSERMRIDSSGNVGIGVTSPSSRLHVVDSISAGGAGVITATDTSSNDFGVGLAIRKTTTTTSSSQRFIQFFANGVGQPMGGIVGNGAEQAQFIQLSDERYKENIKPLSGILDKVNKLKTVSFDWKHINESVEAGFIAQNVQELFPEYVIKNIANEGEKEKMGTTGGMTGGFIAVLTAAIQELSAKVAALEAA